MSNPLEFIGKLKYDKANVKQQLLKETIKKIDDGTIKNEATAKALLGPDWPRASGKFKQERSPGNVKGSNLQTPSVIQKTVDKSIPSSHELLSKEVITKQ